MKKYVVVDVDGTIAINPERQERIMEGLNGTKIEDMPWEKLFGNCEEDAPIEPMVGLVKKLSNHYHVVFCTSRNIMFRDKTREWINRYMGLRLAPLLMRKSPQDHRSDTIVKPELLEEAGITPENTAFILEDKNSTVKAWRDLGFTVLQPADNTY